MVTATIQEKLIPVSRLNITEVAWGFQGLPAKSTAQSSKPPVTFSPLFSLKSRLQTRALRQ